MAKTTTIPIAQSIKQIAATISRTAPGAPTSTFAGGPSVITGSDTVLPAVTNLVALALGGTDGTVVKALHVSSTDASLAHVVQLWLAPVGNVPANNGTGMRYVGSINVPLSSGGIAGTVVNIDLLSLAILVGLSFDSVGKPVFAIEPGWGLYAGATVAMTTLTYLHFAGHQEDL